VVGSERNPLDTIDTSANEVPDFYTCPLSTEVIMPTSKKALQNSVKEVISELTDVDVAEIESSDRLRDDLGLDSLQEMELMSRLSEEYEIDPDMDEVMAIKTVKDVVKFLLENLEE